MNVAGIIHAELENKGIKVISVSEDGSIVFDDAVTEVQKQEAWEFFGNFKRPTRVEIEEKIRGNQESLLMQLLIERFYPDYAGSEADDGSKS